MLWFKRNKDEAACAGGKKHFANVIKNTGSSNFLLWRQPEEDFNDGSTLIVMPSEEAVFIKDGVVEGVFKKGKYTLSTQNHPFLSALINTRTGGVSVYHCVIYFVKTSLSFELLWGTRNPVSILASVEGYADKATVEITANGSFKVKITDAVAFVTKLIGNNMHAFTIDDLDNFFFTEFQSIISDNIAMICSEMPDIRRLSEKKRAVQDAIAPFIHRRLQEYGMDCEAFSVADLNRRPNAIIDAVEKTSVQVYEQARQGDVQAQNTVKQGEAEARVTIAMGQAEAQVKLQQGLTDVQILKARGVAQKEIMDIMGDLGWTKQQVAEILRVLAENPGSGGLAATGAGLGMGMAMSGPFANLFSQSITALTKMEMSTTPAAPPPSGRFEEAPTTETPFAALSEIRRMFDAGLISEEEYNQKKREILSRM